MKCDYRRAGVSWHLPVSLLHSSVANLIAAMIHIASLQTADIWHVITVEQVAHWICSNLLNTNIRWTWSQEWCTSRSFKYLSITFFLQTIKHISLLYFMHRQISILYFSLHWNQRLVFSIFSFHKILIETHAKTRHRLRKTKFMFGDSVDPP